MPEPTIRPRFVPLEDRTAPSAAIVLENNTLVPIDTAFPTLPRTTVPVTGLGTGESLVGIDYRPQNGHLYGLSYDHNRNVRLYDVNDQTGAATPLTASPVGFSLNFPANGQPHLGTSFGFDFDPTTDQARVVTNAGFNFRIDPNTGQLVDGDPATPGVQPDPNLNGGATRADATAFTNNTPGATVTTQYTLDSASDQLYIQNPSTAGTLTAGLPVTLNGSPLAFTAPAGFDIPQGIAVATAGAPATGNGLAVLTVGGKTGLYGLSLADGKAALIDLIGTGATPAQGFALAPAGTKPTLVPVDLFAVGSGPGVPAQVRVYNPDGQVRFTLTPYESTFTGGVQVATGDVNGDGVDDIITGTGPGGGPVVEVFDGATGQMIRSFTPYESTFRGGVQVAAGDVNGDGIADIVTGTGVGGGPRIQVFDGKTQAQLADFFAYESTFRGGVQVAVRPAGTLNAGTAATGGLGSAFAVPAAIVTGTGVGGGPRIQMFDARTLAPLANFFAFEPSFRGGVQVAAGDVNGDGAADIIAGTGPGGGPRVVGFDGSPNGSLGRVADFFAFDQSFRGGVQVATVDRDGNGTSDIVAGTGPGIANRVQVYAANGTVVEDLQPFDATFTGGVFVG